MDKGPTPGDDVNPPDDRTVDSDQTIARSLPSAAAKAMVGEGQRYRVLRPHAHGGLGAVYVALDLELNREVALKQILDSHADNPFSRERFVLEAEVTGSLEHPGIVPIYGLGADRDGRPFYAMRFIRGDSLMEAIAHFHSEDTQGDPGARALGLQKLLRRFLDVCNAIDYAHGRGVLHRDIKPGNIIVGKHGETLMIDWGLAKVRGNSATPAGPHQRVQHEDVLTPSSRATSTETVAGTAVGTPAYMSPEQARGDLDALGPASDVYSLGATLYCLLTGEPPFEGKVAAVLGAVIEGRFERPRRRDASIDRALEGICLRAMALAPTERYPSARALADDIERWLADEPVTAVRDPWGTRLRRWGRRHRAAAGGLGVGALTVFTALAISTVLVNRERSKAEANFQQARAAVDTYFTTISESRLLDVPGLQPLRRELLDAALQYYQDFLSEHGDDPSVRKESAAASFRAGWIATQIGNPQAATERYRTAMKLYAELARAEPHELEYRRKLATCNGAMAFLLQPSDEAMAYHRRALAIRQQLARENPTDVIAQNDVARTYGNIASLLRNRGAASAAVAAFDSAAAIGEALVAMPLDSTSTVADLTRRSNPWENIREDLALIHQKRTNVLREVGQLNAADAAWERGYELHQELVKKRPLSHDYQSSLGYHGIVGGTLRMAEERAPDAIPLLESAQATFTALVTGNSSVPRFRGNLTEAQLVLVQALNAAGKKAEALQLSSRAVENARQVFEMEPDASMRTLLVRCLMQNGDLLLNESRRAEALEMFRNACEIQEEGVRAEPESVYHRSTLANVLASRGRAAQASGAREEARQSFARAADLSATMAAQFASQRYSQACYVAMLIPVSPPAARDSLGLEAIAALRLAIEAGYGDRETFAKDSDLDPLRDRADFRELMANLE